MHFALNKIFKLIPDFNSRTMTENDFYNLCERERIEVKEVPLLIDGLYSRRNRRKVIFINEKLRGTLWTLTAFHELAHHFLHETENANCLFGSRIIASSKREKEADAVSLIAIIPQTTLHRFAEGDFDHACKCTIERFKPRYEFYQMFGV